VSRAGFAVLYCTDILLPARPRSPSPARSRRPSRLSCGIGFMRQSAELCMEIKIYLVYMAQCYANYSQYLR
jgi:hypothetical protein